MVAKRVARALAETSVLVRPCRAVHICWGGPFLFYLVCLHRRIRSNGHSKIPGYTGRQGSAPNLYHGFVGQPVALALPGSCGPGHSGLFPIKRPEMLAAGQSPLNDADKLLSIYIVKGLPMGLAASSSPACWLPPCPVSRRV